MQPAVDLGSRIDARWRAAGYREDAFVELAHAELERFIAAGELSAADIATWAVVADELPRQANVPITFGQPPVTLYRTDKFYIEALYWLDGTTAIHDHAFAGAFAVLEGSSLHTTFAFDQADAVDSHLRVGRLSRAHAELLPSGAVRAIVPGRSFIHSLFHLDRPSVSLTVRTFTHAASYPQLEYRRPGLALDSAFFPEGPGRRLAVLDMLAKTDAERYAVALRQFLQRADLLHCFRALEQASINPAVTHCVASGLALVGERFGDHAATLHGAIADTVRQRNVYGRREHVHDPQHRFLLALLLNIPDRDELLTMVRARMGGDDAIAQVVTWLRQMAANGPHALGIALDTAGLIVIEGLLRGWDEAHMVASGGDRLAVAKWSLTLPRTQLLHGLLQ